jgi:hypothetical protein
VNLSYGDGTGTRAAISASLVQARDGTWVTPDHLCPDLLRWENIGAADGWRGRAVRAFFWLMRAWPPPRPPGRPGR